MTEKGKCKCPGCGTDELSEEKYKEAMEKMHAKEKEIMEKMGWYHHCVYGDPDFPHFRNYHTHGLPANFNHPDLQIIVPIDPEFAHQLMWCMVNEINEGKKFQPFQVFSGLLDGYDITFHQTRENERDVLRIIFPDKQNRLFLNDMDAEYQYQWTFNQ